MRVTGIAVWLLIVTVVHGQSGPRPAFEVASIKPNNSTSVESNSSRVAGDRFSATNATLIQLLRSAYAVQQFQVAGGPRWVGVDRFDIAARMPAGQPPELWPVMLQELLASRFRLVLRRATRETDGYALVVAGGAPRLTAVDASKCAVANSSCGMSASPTQIVATGQSMDQLATRLSRSIGQTVVNRTGVTGIYDFTVQWTQDEPFREPGATASPAIFTALTEQLGLRLRSQRIPVEALIIESVERPTPD